MTQQQQICDRFLKRTLSAVLLPRSPCPSPPGWLSPPIRELLIHTSQSALTVMSFEGSEQAWALAASRRCKFHSWHLLPLNSCSMTIVQVCFRNYRWVKRKIPSNFIIKKSVTGPQSLISNLKIKIWKVVSFWEMKLEAKFSVTWTWESIYVVHLVICLIYSAAPSLPLGNT